MSSIETLLTSYLASSTPGEAEAIHTQIELECFRSGMGSDRLREIEAAEQQVNRRFTAQTISTTFIDEHFGHATEVRVLACETLIGLRHAVRDLNPGRIDIFSDHDCTGLVCGMSAKLLKVYKAYTGYFAVVEVSITRDV